MVFSKVISDITIFLSLFRVQSVATTRVSAGITNVSGLAVATLDSVYYSLSLALTLVSSIRKVAIALWPAIVSKVPLITSDVRWSLS